MPRFYAGAADAMNAPFEPKTPCRNMETRPCVFLTMNDSKRYLVNECLPHHCTRHEDKYVEGTIPHDWATEDGATVYKEIGDYHGGPYCLRCEQTFCQHCDPGIWNKPCGEQGQTIFSLQHVEKE